MIKIGFEEAHALIAGGSFSFRWRGNTQPYTFHKPTGKIHLFDKGSGLDYTK